MIIELSQKSIDRFHHFYDKGTKKVQVRWLKQAEDDAKKYGVSELSLYLLWIKNDCKSSFEWPVCKVCSTPLKESQFFRKSQTCCRECNANDPERVKKAESTWMKNYGVDKFWNSKEVQEKARKTNLERYGCEHAAKSQIVQDRIKATNKEKYGVEFPFQSMDIQDKVKDTLVERYGVDNYFKIPENVQNKLLNHRSNNYEHYSEMCISLYNVQLTSTKEQFINDDILHYHCNECGKDFDLSRRVAQLCRCPYCCGKTSEGEREMEEYIRSIYSGIVQHHNKSLSENREIDIFLPDLKIGFEYNGNFYHSVFRKDKFYHQKKTQDALDLGIQLVHIFEYQWNNDKDHCKELIKNVIDQKYDYSKLDVNNVNWNEVDIRPLLQQGYKIEKYNDLTPHYIVHYVEVTEQYFNTLPDITKRNASIIYDAGTIVLNKPS